MKNIIFYNALLLLVMFGIQSCNTDDFLNTPPPTMSDAAYFVNDDVALNALAGVYDPLAWSASEYLIWTVGDATADDAEKGGGGEGDLAELARIISFSANSENSFIHAAWIENFIGLNRANKLIEGITDNPDISNRAEKRILAEAKFLRAVFHFNLMKYFGGIPIMDHVLSPSESMNPRNTIEECWAQVEKDFKAAAAGLPMKSQVNSTELGRATWGAANAFLLKSYVWQEKWASAIMIADSIVNSGEYDLEASYANLFTLESDNGVESVFDIQFSMIPTGWGDEFEGSDLELMQRSRDIRNGGWGFDQPTQDLYDAFEDGDIRRELTIISDGDTLWKGTDDEEIIYTIKDPVNNPDSYTDYNKRKGTLPASQRDNLSEDMSNADLNQRVIRFSEILLWQAEAAAHTGGDWQTPLNKVRARAGLDPVVGTNGLDAVYHERRVELAMEYHRYWDLVRTGRGNLMKDYTEDKRYLPIPQIEINSNPNLVQNPY